MKYQAYVSWTMSKMIEIEATSEADAEAIANEMWDMCKIEIDETDYCLGTFEVNQIDADK